MNQINFDPNTKIKSFSTPTQKTSQFRSPHKKQVNFDPYTKTKLISIQRLKPGHFRTPHQNQLNSDPCTESSQVRSPQWNQVDFDLPHKNEVKFDAHTKTRWFSASVQKPSQARPPAQKLSQSILKTSHFRTAHNKEVNFEKPSYFRSTNENRAIRPAQKPKSILTPARKNKSSSIPTLKPRQFKSIPHIKTKLISTPSLKSSRFWCPI